MYLSAPILANAVDPTVLRALSWQQLQALCFAVSDRYPARPASGAAAAGGGNGGGGGQAGRGTSYQQDGATAAAAAAAGAEASGHPPAASMRSSSPTATPTAQHQQQELQLRFLSLLASGRDGTVFSGVCNGQSVAIKVYSWEGAQVVAYARETRAYQALARLQGSVVPKVGDWARPGFGSGAAMLVLQLAWRWMGIAVDVRERSRVLSGVSALLGQGQTAPSVRGGLA